MTLDFELNSIENKSSDKSNDENNLYELNFSNNIENKTITLEGKGSLKETIKI